MNDDIQPPDHFNDAQRALWAETLTDLTTAGTLERVDPRSLAAYITAVHANTEASALLNQSAPLIRQGDRLIPNPAIQVIKETSTTMIRFARTFRLTAAPQPPDQPEHPQQAPEAASPMQHGRWCPEHGRWECKGGRSRGRGECHAPRQVGNDTCRMHPGPDAEVKRVVELNRRKVGGIPLNVSPTEALLIEVRRGAGICAWLDSVVADLREQEVLWGKTKEVRSDSGEFPGREVTFSAVLNGWIRYQQREREMLVAATSAAVRANIEGQYLALAKAQGQRIFEAFEKALRQLSLSEDQWATARAVIPGVLVELTTAA
jgi:hypothetical protein